jgi:glycosyltransferase involved in cell wall biosynthesis
VVIPTYNREHEVVEAIESALGQSLPPAEVIVVDDGSTDGTRERLVPLLDRIVYIRQENQGVSAARNAGIRAAKGDLVAFLDSDDLWHPRKLELQLHYLENHPKVALVGAVSCRDPLPSWPDCPDSHRAQARRVRSEDVVLRSQLVTSTVVIRKHCFDAVGFFDTALRNAEDRDLFARIGMRHQMVQLAAVLAWGGREGDHLSMVTASGEEATRKMITDACRRLDSFGSRLLLRRQALSNAAFEASYTYLSNGERMRALHRVFRSVVLWPFPIPDDEAIPFRRVKRLIRIILALCWRS